MKNFFKIFFITLGVIFSLILMFVLYLVIFDPFNIKPLLFGDGKTFNIPQDTTIDANTDAATSTNTTGNKVFLSDAQRKTLEGLGIDPASLPSTITATQEACFKTKLGETRFAEILAGDSPSIPEFLNAKSCL